jgi:hypothetical protein
MMFHSVTDEELSEALRIVANAQSKAIDKAAENKSHLVAEYDVWQQAFGDAADDAEGPLDAADDAADTESEPAASSQDTADYNRDDVAAVAATDAADDKTRYDTEAAFAVEYDTPVRKRPLDQLCGYAQRLEALKRQRLAGAAEDSRQMTVAAETEASEKASDNASADAPETEASEKASEKAYADAPETDASENASEKESADAASAVAAETVGEDIEAGIWSGPPDPFDPYRPTGPYATASAADPAKAAYARGRASGYPGHKEVQAAAEAAEAAAKKRKVEEADLD